MDKNRSTKLLQENKKVSNRAIVVTVQSPQVTNLTVVDTPGIIKNINSDPTHQYVQLFKDIVANEIQGEEIVGGS